MDLDAKFCKEESQFLAKWFIFLILRSWAPFGGRDTCMYEIMNLLSISEAHIQREQNKNHGDTARRASPQDLGRDI